MSKLRLEKVVGYPPTPDQKGKQQQSPSWITHAAPAKLSPSGLFENS